MQSETGITYRHEVLLAAAVLAASLRHDSGGLPSIEFISSLLFQLKKQGIDLGEIALSRVPGGFYSEDIETLIGHYLAAGYAREFSPVDLTDSGRQALSEIIAEERRQNPRAVKQIEAVLGDLPA